MQDSWHVLFCFAMGEIAAAIHLVSRHARVVHIPVTARQAGKYME
jgi:hypothetical protein